MPLAYRGGAITYMGFNGWRSWTKSQKKTKWLEMLDGLALYLLLPMIYHYIYALHY